VNRARRLLPVAALAILAACGPGHATSAPYRPAGALSGHEGGFVLYQRDCAWCHGNQGSGTPNGPTLLAGTAGPALTDFMLSTGRMPVAFPGQKDALHGPSVYTPAEIAAIVDFVRSLNPPGPEVPVVDLGGADLARGRDLYQENCAPCHSMTGAGGALATGKTIRVNGYALPGHVGLIAPSLLHSTPQQVVEAMRSGPPGMPVFGPQAISDPDANSVALFVQQLQREGDRGGLGLGGIGPVAEGAVGWIVGLGLLLLLVRWIGTGGRDATGHGEGR